MHPRLEQRLSALKNQLSSLQGRLNRAATKIREDGEIPSKDLAYAIVAIRNQFRDLKEEAALHVSDGRKDPRPIRTTRDLREAIKYASPEYLLVHEEAERVLTEVLQIVDKEHGSEPVAEAHEAASDLLHVLEDFDGDTAQSDAEAIADGEHPLAALCTLAHDDGSLSDEVWQRHLDVVSEAFPELRVSIMRGRLTVRKTDPSAEREGVQKQEQDGEAPASSPLGKGESSVDEACTGPDENENTAADGEHYAAEEDGEALDSSGYHEDEESRSAASAAADPDRQREESETQAEVTPTDDRMEGRSTDEKKPESSREKEEKLEKPATLNATVEGEAPENGVEGETRADPIGARSVSEQTLANASIADRDDIATAAGILQQEAKDSSAQALLLGGLFDQRKEGLAYHIFRGLEEAEEEVITPAWLIEGVLLGPHLRAQSDKIALHLQFTEDITPWIEEERSSGTANWLMALAAVIRPALHAPRMTSALTLLESLCSRSKLKPILQYAENIRKFAKQRRPINPTVFEVSDREGVGQRFNDLVDEVKNWRVSAAKKTSSYVPATRAWHRQLRNGTVGEVCEVMIGEEQPLQEGIRRVKSTLKWFEDLDYQQIFREETGLAASLEGSALQWMKDQFGTARNLAQRWVQLAEERLRAQDDSASYERDRALVAQLQARHNEAVDALERVCRNDRGSLLAVAAGRLTKIIKELNGQFSGEEIYLTDEPDPNDILNADLLQVPGLPASSGSDSVQFLSVALDAIENEKIGWESAFEAFTGNEHYDFSQRLIDVIRSAPSWNGEAVDLELDRLEEHHEENLHRSRNQLNREADRVDQEINHAFHLGYLDRNQRANLLQQNLETKNAVSGCLDLGGLRADLQTIRDEIGEQKEQAVEKVRARFESKEVQEKIAEDGTARERIDAVLQGGDVYTANTYIDRVLAGEALPAADTKGTALEDFYSNKLRPIREKYGSPDAVHRLTQALKEGEDTKAGSVLSFADLKPESRKQAGDIIETWMTIRRNGEANEKDLQMLLSSLGFEPTDLEVNTFGASTPGGGGRRRRWASVEMASIAERDDCPVPAYGSRTGGRYRLVLLHGNPPVEEVGSDVGLVDVDDPATVVLYFGTLGQEERRELSAYCREKKAGFIVLDKPLFFFLMGMPRSKRLRAFFDCTLPFSYQQPYSEVGGRIPHEMFFGREDEIDKIKNPNGPSLIYGGRQLGKTVLLRQAKRQFQDRPDRIASWIDLRSKGVVDEETRKIWPILVEELNDEGVLDSEEVNRKSKPKRIVRHIRAWIEEKSHRRLLLLLDEADAFFDQEQKTDFKQTRRLKNLMESTDGRFKVVFAGLHNVLRVTEAPNQPLAHLSTPICVGPLLKDGEWQAARDLVERPLAALGYRFKSSSLVTFILSRTNYYPSLIQLYCRYLLEEVVGDAGLGPADDGPPYMITEANVREPYDGQSDLMRQIRERFLWTLQLDSRYEVLAYAIGYAIETGESDGEPAQGRRDDDFGFTVEWVQREAIDWWKEGFRGSASREHIQALLDEMVGLGVLRKPETDRYTLRSPNVLPLLGGRKKMERVLAKDRVPKWEFDPRTHRRQYGNRKQKGRSMAPVTSHQLKLLQQPDHGVAIVYGTPAAGIQNVSNFLSSVHRNGAYRRFSEGGVDAFEKWLSETKEKRPDDTVSLALVGHEVEWNQEWVDRALAQTGRLRSPHAFFRVVFLAGPETVWTLGADQKGYERDATVLQLQPWHDAALYTWFIEREQSLTPSQMNEIGQVTGNWPLLVRKLGSAMRGAPSQWDAHLDEIRQSLKDPDDCEAYLQSFGLPEGERRQILSILAILDDDEAPPRRVYRIASDEEATSEPSGITPGAISSLVEDALESLEQEATVKRVRSILNWGRRLGVTTQPRKDRWQMDPLVRRLLSTVST